MSTAQHEDLTLDVTQQIEVAAPIGEVYQSLIDRLTKDSAHADGTPMPMVLEPWPGGRWFRDLGDHQGHLWGFVQVIKPPTLLEIQGPLFMSYAVSGHVQFRLTPTPGGTELTLRHCAVGMIPEPHRQSLGQGWQATLQAVKSHCE